MYLLSNIHYTKEKLNTLYQLGIKYKWLGPEAPIVYRWLFRLLRPTYLGKIREQWIAEGVNQFNREFKNLQRVSSIPPRYWDNSILNSFEKYLIDEQAATLEQCIKLYNLENPSLDSRKFSLTRKNPLGLR